MSGHLTVISSNTNCTKEPCYCFRQWVTHTEQTLVTKTRFSHREASLKMLLVSKWKYPRSVCEAGLGSVLTVSCYGACPLCMSKCFCQQQQLLTSTIFFMHFHKWTNSFTASGHKNLLLDEPWTQPPPYPPEMMEPRNMKESPTRYNQSHSPVPWIFFFCLYTNTLSTDLHMKRVQDCDRSRKKKKKLITYKILPVLEQKWQKYEINHCHSGYNDR